MTILYEAAVSCRQHAIACNNELSNSGGFHVHPPHTHYSWLKLQAALIFLAFMAAGQAANAQEQIDYRATASAPVHLMRASNGAAFTALVDRHPVTGELRVKKRPVRPHEITELEAKGVTLAFLPDPDEASAPKTEALSDDTKQGGPSPSVPASFTIMRFYGYTYGGFWTTAARPQGKTTHWSSFNLRSTGFASTVEHVAHSLIFDGTAVAPPTPALIGNGIAIGKLAGYPEPSGVGCGPVTNPGYYAEVESFWRGGNWLYPNTCTSTGLLLDEQMTAFSLHANTNQWVAYWIQRNGQTVFTSPAVNTAGQRPSWNPNNGGVLFTVTGGDGDLRYPDYVLQFSNVQTGWF